MKAKHNWSPEDIAKLKSEFPHKKTQDIADEMNLNYSQISNKANSLEIKKTKEFIRVMGSEHGKKSPAHTRFKKGQIPLNKGKKQIEYMSLEAIEKSKATRFKKGNEPHNTKFNGYERISIDGYREVRISQGKFVFVHRKNWEEKHGPIPAGLNLVFKSTNKLDCSIENLELISNAELMLRNTIQRYPEELQQVIRLKGKLTREIQNYGE